MPYVKRHTRRRPTKRRYVPKRKRVSRPTTRRTYRKARGYNRGTYASKTFGLLYKNREFTKFTYETGATITVPALQINASHFWRANSIYDPDYSNIGYNSSCIGWTLASTLYNQYRVYGAWFEISFVTPPSVTVPVQVVLSSANDVASGFANTITNMQMANRPGARSFIIYPAAAGGKKTMRIYVSNPKCIGLSKEQYRTDSMTYAPTNGNPTWLSVLAISAFNAVDYSNSTGFSLSYHIKITYLTELFDLKEQNAEAN